MNNKKLEKNHRSKKVFRFGVTNTNDKDKIILNDNKSNASVNKTPKPLTELSARLQSAFDKSHVSDNQEDCKKKSILTMSLKMNSYFSSNGFDNNNLKYDDIAPLSYFAASKYEKNDKPKLEKTCKPKICGSCKNNSTKIKYKSHKAQLHVSIKSKKTMTCSHNDKNEEPVYESDDSNLKRKHSNCSVCSEKETLRSDLLLHFLYQMRNIVSTKELKFDSLKIITERLVQDRKNAELLMLMDLIIRFQVNKVKEIIFQDLLSKEIIPVNFVRVFLKQYEFLKSLSLAYSDILKDYESNYLLLNDLSFDLINRAHFKIHLYDNCKEIQDLIDAGHFNIKDELIFDIKTSDKEKERVRIIFSDMKSDFETSAKWRCIQKKIEYILKNSFEVGKSLLKYLHSYFSIFSDRNSDLNKDRFDMCHNDAEKYINSLKELAKNNSVVQLNDLPVKSLSNTSSFDCGLKAYELDDPNCDSSISNIYGYPRKLSNSSVGMKMNCQNIYKSLANVKPPSLSRSSSSTNSNGYNSCVSTSSFDDSSDDDEADRESAKILHNLKHKRNTCDSLSSNLHDNSVNEETKPPTPVSFNGDEECESRFDDGLEDGHKRFVFNDKEQSWNNGELNHDDIEKFNKLYEKYLAENEHLLLDNSNNSPPTHMSVPDCIKSLQSAESLHSLLSSIMDKCKKGLDTHDKRPCHSTAHFPEADSEHIYFSSTSCGKHSDTSCSNYTEESFSLDPNLIGMKDDDFEMDFEELSRTLSPNSTIHDNLKEFEKYLGRSSENPIGAEKAHPHLHALVKTCRIYCNKLYKRSSKDELECTESVESLSDSGKNISSDTKQTTIVIEQISDNESCGGPDDCTSAMNVDIDSNQENCSNNNTSVNNNLSSSETGSSSSTGTENAGNSKVCNCCKCEMFGEQNIFSHSRNATNVVEKLRLKLQKRKQCQLKPQSKKSLNNSLNHNGTLEDVDTLVKFINGNDDGSENIIQIPETIASASKKSKSKPSKPDLSQLKTKPKVTVPVEESKAVSIQNAKSSKKIIKSVPNANGFVTNSQPTKVNDVDFKLEKKSNKAVLKDKSTNKEYHPSNLEELTINSCDDLINQHTDEDKEMYDPVVEDFKKFCEKVLVVPKRRKKLPIDATLLISELEKCQQENKNSNLLK